MADSTLFLDLAPGDRLKVGGVNVELISKSGRMVRLRVQAPRDVRIERQPADQEQGQQPPSFVPRLRK